MSAFQSIGLSVTVEDPLIKSNRSLLRRLTSQVERYRQEKRAVGGYYSARIEIKSSLNDIDDWVQGLGRHIVTYSPDLVVVWEGFVNRVIANAGPAQLVIGPLIDVANRVSVFYPTIDTTVSPPVVGAPTTTAVANDTNSQTKYGIIEKVSNSPPASSTEAEQLRDTLLNDLAFPATSRRSNLSGERDPSVILDCLGYWHWLNTYVYSNASTGTHNLSDKIIAIRDDEPNTGIFSSDNSKVTSNTIQVQQEETSNTTALIHMENLSTVGDTSNNRYNIGFYTGRQLIYEVAPTTIKYQQRLTDNQGIIDLLGGRVRPWDVEPGEWLFYPDLLVGQLPPVTEANLRQDIRAGYIESVRFDAPYEVTVNGNRLGEADQLLARLGLRGF